MAKKTLTNAEIEKLVEAARDRYVAERLSTPDQIKQLVTDRMGRGVSDILARVVGLCDRWGRWEYDSCNGRQSALTEAIRKEISKAGEAILTDAIRGWQPGAKFRMSVRKAYEEYLMRALECAAEAKAKADAAAMLDALLLPESDNR